MSFYDEAPFLKTERMATELSEQEGVFGSENLSSAYLEPVNSEEEIDYSLVYALFTFVASMEGQISVLSGEPLELLDDSNSYWWAVKCISTGDIGYIPAENIETPYEKLARFNRHRNIQLTTMSSEDANTEKKEKTTRIAFAEYHTEIYTDGESEIGLPVEDEIDILQEKKSNEKKPTSFLGRFFKPKKEAPIEVPESSRHGQRQIDQESTQSSIRKVTQPLRKHSIDDTPLESREDLDKAPINVLKVFSGNVNFNATFKSVSFERGTLAKDLILNALKKFRSTSNPNDYYLTVTPLQHNPELAALGERRLLPNESINKVLDSYGVISYISSDRRGKEKKPISRVNQADGTIKFTLNTYDKPFEAAVRVCFDNGNGINRWEKINVKDEAKVDDLLQEVIEAFGVSNQELGFQLYSLSSKSVITQDNFTGLLSDAQDKGQVLTLKLIYANEVQSLSSGSRLDPGIMKVQSFDSSMNSNSINANDLPENKGLGFDALLSDLEASIVEQSKTRLTSEIGLHQTLETIEKDLESLISAQMRKNAQQRRSGRLSMMMQKVQEEGSHEIDCEKLFSDLKDSGSTLRRLEGKLNLMVGVILARNNLITINL